MAGPLEQLGTALDNAQSVLAEFRRASPVDFKVLKHLFDTKHQSWMLKVLVQGPEGVLFWGAVTGLRGEHLVVNSESGDHHDDVPAASVLMVRLLDLS